MSLKNQDLWYNIKCAAIAQLVERIHGKDEVTSSNLVRGSIFISGSDRGRGFVRDGDGGG